VTTGAAAGDEEFAHAISPPGPMLVGAQLRFAPTASAGK
jgi:hypothetical protein